LTTYRHISSEQYNDMPPSMTSTEIVSLSKFSLYGNFEKCQGNQIYYSPNKK